MTKKKGLVLAGSAALAGYGVYRAVKAIKNQPPGTKKYYHGGRTWVYKGYPKGTPRSERKKTVVIGQPHTPGRIDKALRNNRVSRYTSAKFRNYVLAKQRAKKQKSKG